MRLNESYVKPISLRNVIYSAMITVVGCFGLWGFWRSAIPVRQAPLVRSELIVRYTPRTAGAMGVTWSSVPIGLPNRIGFDGAAQREDSRFQAFLTPPPLPVELGGDQKQDLADRFGPALEWAVSGRPAPVRYVPVPVDPPVFAPSSVRGRAPLDYDWMDELRGVDWVSVPVIDSVSLRLGTKPVSLTVWVDLAPGGWVDHVFLESPSGRAEIDRAVVRALMTLRAPPGRTGMSGRVRVSVAGMEPPGSSMAVDKE
jgi:hypothetical protein